MPPLTFPAIPPCPAAPCTLEEFASWATQVIALLQPHSCKPLIAQSATPVEFCFAALGSKTLGRWSGSLHRISIHADHAEKSCRYDTAAARHTLLHECAHMLAPQGDGHGPAFRRICKALGIRGNATGTVAIRTQEDRFAVRLRTTGEIIRYSPTPVDVSEFSFIPGRQRETLGKLECIDLTSATNESTIENTKMSLSPAQIIGAEPMPGTPDPQTTPADTIQVPSFDARAPYHQLAGCVAASIPYGKLFRMDGRFVTIKVDDKGQIQTVDMTPERLVTWLPEQKYCTFHGGKRKNAAPDEPPPVTSISPAQAAIILKSDVFTERMPELSGIATVRLPVITSATKATTTVHTPGGETVQRHLRHYQFEPTAEGYDPRSKIYTHSTIRQDFTNVIALEKARRFLVRAYAEAALDGGFEGDEAIHPLQSRSLGAVICAMLGQYLHHCINTFPLILVVANQAGTGKSFLTRCMLTPIHGDIEADNYQDDDKEFRQTLNSLLLSGARFCWLDDVKSLKSPTLNRFITSSRIRDRILHSQTTFSKEMRMQFFATGNGLKVTPDLQRRSLPIDLFYASDSTQRTFRGILTEEMLTQPDIRSTFLACLWSLTYHWQQAGCPRYIEKAAGGAFAQFVDLAANITIHAGFANPYGPRMVDLDSGDTAGKALQEVLITMADSITPPYGQPHRGAWQKFRVADLEDIATRMHKIEIIVPYGNNKRDNLGQAMRGMKGRELTDNRGRRFSIGSRRDSASSLYQFTILSEPTRELSDTAATTLAEALGRDPDPDPEF